MSREMTRKELFRELFGSLRDRVQPRPSSGRDEPSARLRPPGAVEPDERFLRTCTGCADCVPACPHGAIFIVEAGVDGSDRQVASIAPLRQPCMLCVDLPCIAACPDGALEPLPAPAAARLGVAQVDPRRCRTFHGDPCDLCHRHCPLPGDAIKMIGGKPVVMPAACTGCGICESVCPDRPRSIRVYAERDLVPVIRVPRHLPGSAG